MFDLSWEMVQIAFLIFLIDFLFSMVITYIAKGKGNVVKVKLEIQGRGEIFVFLFEILILAPVIEELLFRSWILLFSDSRSALIFILVSSFIFGGLHSVKAGAGLVVKKRGNLVKVIAYTMTGLLLGILVFITRSIAIAMIIHSVHNLLWFVLGYQSKKKIVKNIDRVIKRYQLESS